MDDTKGASSKGLYLLGVVRVADRAVLAWHASSPPVGGGGSSGYTGAALKEVSGSVGRLIGLEWIDWDGC